MRRRPNAEILPAIPVFEVMARDTSPARKVADLILLISLPGEGLNSIEIKVGLTIFIRTFRLDMARRKRRALLDL